MAQRERERAAIRHARWQDIQRAKPLYLETLLVEGGQPRAVIVAAEEPAYWGQAEKVRDAVLRATGVELPIAPDDALDPWSPPPANAIIIGNLNTNQLVPPLYALNYVAADSFYPGVGGHVLHTVHDPWGLERNAILVGGSDVAGVEASARLLIASLRADDARLWVPPVLDVALGPAVLERVPDLALEPDAAFLEREMAAARTMLETSAHGGITEPLARAGYLYYLTGKVGWAELFRRLAYLMYKDFQSGREQYGGPWGMDADFRLHKMLPAWDLVEEAPVFTDADRLEITRILAQFIVDCIPHADAALQDRNVRHNHTTFAALGLLYSGLYFRKYYGLQEAEEWLAIADECFVPQGQGWRPVEDSNGYQWVTLYHMSKYALSRPAPEFLEAGHLREAADLVLASSDNLGYQASYGDTRDPFGWGSELPLLTMAAWYYGDGEYEWLYRQQRSRLPMLLPAAEIGAYNADVEPVEPRRAIGIQRVPMDRRFYLSTGGPKVLPLEQSFDKIAFRADLDPDAEYLLLDGISCGGHRHYDGNSFIRLTALGRIWLADCDYYCSTPNFHNGVLPVRDGLSADIPPFAWGEITADLPSIGFTRTTAEDYAGCDWERNVIWCKRRYFAVVDTMKARVPGEFDFRALWRVLGDVDLHGRTLTAVQQDARFEVVNGDGAALSLTVDERTSANWEHYRLAKPVVHVLQQGRSQVLAAGQSLSFANVLRAYRADERQAEVRRAGEGAMFVRDDTGIAWMGAGCPSGGPVSTDASMWWVGEATIALANGTRLECPGFHVASDRPVSLELDLERMEVTLIADYATLLTLALPGVVGATVDGSERAVRRLDGGISLSLPEGRHRVSLLGDGVAAAGGLAQAVRSAWDAAAMLEPATAGGRAASETPAWALASDADCTALAVVRTAKGEAVAVGDAEGGVRLVTATGRVLWRAEVAGRVTALSAASFGAGDPVVIVGSSACEVSAFDASGALLWRFAVPYYKRDGVVRVLLAADLDGDGREEVLAGAENWHYYALDCGGRLLWKYESVHASTAAAIADVDGDGRLEAVLGTEYYWWSCVGPDGAKKWQHNTVYGPGVAAVATVADGAGRRLSAFGCVDGTTQVVDWEGKLRFVLRTGDSVAALVASDLDGDGQEELLVASANNNVYSVAPTGEIRWRRRLGGAPTHMLVAGAGPSRLVVADDRGVLYRLSGSGDVLATTDIGGAAEALYIVSCESGPVVLAAVPGAGLRAWPV